MKNFIYVYFTFLLLLIIFTSLYLYCTNLYSTENFPSVFSTNTEFVWPLPNNYNITSYFGPRKSPTAGASSVHSGIDIAASEGTPIYSVLSCKVISTGFKGAGGYTIITESNEYKVSYCHVSPNFIVSPGDIIEIGEQIGNVGPKNVYTVPNNPYKDSSGNPTNGATTGCHLHLTIKKNGDLVNPLNYFDI